MVALGSRGFGCVRSGLILAGGLGRAAGAVVREPPIWSRVDLMSRADGMIRLSPGASWSGQFTCAG